MREVLIVAALAACSAAADPPTESGAARARASMHARFDASRRAEQAIALGDLDRARAEARVIAGLDAPDVLSQWRSYLDDVRQAARHVDGSQDLVAAAKATAQLGRHCAKCHVATSAKITFAKQPAPGDPRRLAPQMASHQWAAARLWEGLVGASDERWQDGAKQLSAASLTITAESDRLGIADDTARMRLYAKRALTTAKPDERAALYGELLATCAHCHYTIRDTRP